MIAPYKSKSLPAPPTSQVSINTVSFGTIKPSAGSRICLYGTGGIGKTSLALKLEGRTAFFDCDGSLPQLEKSNPGLTKDVASVSFSTWQDIRAALRYDGWDSIQNIVIDTATELQKLCTAHVLKTIPKEKGGTASSILDYGYGKGYRHLFDQFLLLLADLDAHYRAGRSVVLICHEVSAKVPNPGGEEYIRWEPDLFQTANESIRAKVKNWADFVLFLSYDIAVKDGRASGAGTRTLYTDEQPYFMAKSRGAHEQIVITDADCNPWPKIFGQQ
jgi:hypothetical protein